MKAADDSDSAERLQPLPAKKGAQKKTALANRAKAKNPGPAAALPALTDELAAGPTKGIASAVVANRSAKDRAPAKRRKVAPVAVADGTGPTAAAEGIQPAAVAGGAPPAAVADGSGPVAAAVGTQPAAVEGGTEPAAAATASERVYDSRIITRSSPLEKYIMGRVGSTAAPLRRIVGCTASMSNEYGAIATKLLEELQESRLTKATGTSRRDELVLQAGIKR